MLIKYDLLYFPRCKIKFINKYKNDIPARILFEINND